jgi:integrase
VVRALFPCHIQLIPKKNDNERDRYALVITQAVKDENIIGSTKGGKARAVEMPDRAVTMIKDLMECTHIEAENEFIFPGDKENAPLDYSSVTASFDSALIRAGIDRGDRWLVPYSFRHTYVSRTRGLYGKRLFEYMIGHEDGKTTDGYDHRDPVQRLIEFQNNPG